MEVLSLEYNAAPSRIINPSITANGNCSFTLNWDTPSYSSITGYEIQTISGSTLVASQSQTTFTNTPSSSGAIYYVSPINSVDKGESQVIAMNEICNSIDDNCDGTTNENQGLK